jgi:hypothetical protein
MNDALAFTYDELLERIHDYNLERDVKDYPLQLVTFASAFVWFVILMVPIIHN